RSAALRARWQRLAGGFGRTALVDLVGAKVAAATVGVARTCRSGLRRSAATNQGETERDGRGNRGSRKEHLPECTPVTAKLLCWQLAAIGSNLLAMTSALRRAFVGAAVALAASTFSCSHQEAPIKDARAEAAASAGQRLQGRWTLVSFQPETPLEP